MASMRDIKNRIKSVGSTQQITKAMHLVATSKLQKSKSTLDITRPYFNEMRRLIGSIVTNTSGVVHPFFEDRYARNVLVVVMAGDRGLCGGYNVNICKKASAFMKECKHEVSAVTVGTKARDYFRRRQRNIVKSYSGISEKPYYDDATDIVTNVVEAYTEGGVDEVWLAYTEFKSVLSHEPKLMKLLPVEKSAFEGVEGVKHGAPMDYEPDSAAVLDFLFPKYLNTVMYGALVEASACELGARMTAMDSASSNADDMIDKLTFQFNRARQGAITQELNEIVGGASALE